MKRTPEYVEDPEARTRFETAMKYIVAVPLKGNAGWGARSAKC
jgi:hypothetical protein